MDKDQVKKMLSKTIKQYKLLQTQGAYARDYAQFNADNSATIEYLKETELRSEDYAEGDDSKKYYRLSVNEQDQLQIEGID